MSAGTDSVENLREPGSAWAGRRLANAWLRSSFQPLFTVYVYLLVLLPSGSIFHVNVKMICFALLLPGALFAFLENRRTTLLHACVLALMPILFAAWIVVSQFYAFNIALSLSQYKDVGTTLATCWLAAVFCSDRSRRLLFLKTVLYAEAVTCVLKTGLLAYCFARGVSVAALVDAISAFFGVQLMAMDFESALGRIQFIADGLIPLCVYMLLRYRRSLRIGVWEALVLFLFLLLSLAFTFSRYFWAFAAVAFVLGFVGGKKDRFHLSVFLLLGVTVAVSLPALISLYQLRFSTAIAGDSDSVRTDQIPPLGRFFLDAPLLGHGFGSYTNEILRSDELPYAYEVQLYALAGQIGLCGLLLMTSLLVLYFQPLWKGSPATLGRRVSLGLLLLVWLTAGLYNPMLLNSAAALSYAVLRELAGLSEEPSTASQPRRITPEALASAGV